MTIDCHPLKGDDSQLGNAILKRAMTDRAPFNGYFALTHRCPLRCRHCYLGCQDEIRRHHEEELSLEEITDILDQLAEAGTMLVIFTGGEAMLRPDFTEIYEYAAKKGFLIAVMSNATLVTPEIVKLFKKYPPRVIEVSMYGATPQTYETITQVPGSHNSFMKGVELLHSNDIRFLLKSVLMKQNRHELAEMEQIAKQYEVSYRYDSAIFPIIQHADNSGRSNMMNDGEDDASHNALLDPIKERIPGDELSKIDFATTERLEQWQKMYIQEKDKQLSKKLITCFAGLTTFHITHYGHLQSCMLIPSPNVDLKKSSFLDGWGGALAELRKVDGPPELQCRTCSARPVCATCPAMVKLETGEHGKISDYLCNTAQKRIEVIKKYEEIENRA